PGSAGGAVVFPHGPPLAFRQVWPPAPPVSRALFGFFESPGFLRHRRAFSCIRRAIRAYCWTLVHDKRANLASRRLPCRTAREPSRRSSVTQHARREHVSQPLCLYFQQDLRVGWIRPALDHISNCLPTR